MKNTSEEFDVFLSHSSRDKRLAVRVETGLSRSGMSVWIDHENIRAGGLLLDALQAAIVASRSLVLLWSKPASESRYVSAEWQAAWLLEKAIIPCRLDETPLPPFLLRHRYCDFQKLYKTGFSELSAALGRRPKPTKPRSQRKPSKRLMDVVREIDGDQRNVLDNLNHGETQVAADVQADLNKRVDSALRRYPKNPLVLSLAGYHKKNEFMVERDVGHLADDRPLEEAERYFFEALSVRPDNPIALNGIGSVLTLRGELDAAEFYVRRAIDRARQEGTSYAAANHDLKLIQKLKQDRTDPVATYARDLAALLRAKTK